ncbi:MAG: SUMF1/EgtB/PvdO family nonheme iron enzyme [Candidatus Coatesbacteria bacterium]|nr:SUMF1/EgtB/PvdO family nonheme iron enzyme [Candidatus Coatesbacteria bacterium]
MRTHRFVVVVLIFLGVLCPLVVVGEETGRQVWQKCPLDMVPADTFCIDKFEYPNEPGTMPRAYVAFAEAVQICLSQGKRLCTTDEWSRACSGPRKLEYPYGNELRQGACNLGTTRVTQHWTWYGLRKTDRDVELSEPAVAGRYRDCVSDYGAYDMVGNYWEWTDAGLADQTILMGGGWGTPSDTVSCVNKTEEATKLYRIRSVSFRCCRDFLSKPQTDSDVQEPSK